MSSLYVTVSGGSITVDRLVEATGMSGDLVQLVNEASPYVVSAVSAYGGAVLAKTKDEAADAAVSVGRRLLQRIFGKRQAGEPVPQVLADVVQHPGDADYLGALRLAWTSPSWLEALIPARV